MNTTKVYANMLAVIESDRLDAERLRRVVESKTVADAFKMLADYGYAYTAGDSADAFIVGETDRLINFVEETSPSKAVAEALTARYVYNNAKLAYKSRFVSVPNDGYYAVATDAEKIAGGDYSEVDKFMAEALNELDAAGKTRPKEIDLALTRAMYKKILSCGVPFIKKYFRAEIDMKNILSAARMKRLGLTDDEFLNGGTVPTELLDSALTAEDGKFAEVFENTRYGEYAQRIENDGFGELWRAENGADEYLYYMTDTDVTNFSSYKPFLKYYTQTLIELKTVKTALVCVKTNSREMFYRRIPQIYAR